MSDSIQLFRPVVNAEVIQSVIKSLGARVEQEQLQHLRAVRTSEAQTASLGMQNTGWELGHESTEVDFETLVGRSATGTPHGDSSARGVGSPSVMDDWGNDMAWLQPKSDPVPVSSQTIIYRQP